jgi:phosphoserine phosphatase
VVLNFVLAEPNVLIESQILQALQALGIAKHRVLLPGIAWQARLPSAAHWRAKLVGVFANLPIDWMLLSDDWRPQLAVFDMDSTLITMEVIDELAALANAKPQVAAITAAAMRGDMDFKESFAARMQYLAGLPQSQMHQVVEEMQLMPGAQQLLQWLQGLSCRTAIVSGGFDYFAKIVQQRLQMDAVIANLLEIEAGHLTGRVLGQVVDAEHKRQSLCDLAASYGVAMANTLVVGDGANDLPMLKAAGIGLAFHAKPNVQQQAPWSARFISMDQIPYLLASI